MMNEEFVEVIAGGMRYGGFDTMEVTAAINEAARTFTLSTTEHPGEWNFPPGTPVEIESNGDLLVNGYVNKYHADGNFKQHRVRIAGRGKGQDFVDSSAVHPTGHWEKKKPDEIARDLDKFGVGVVSMIQLAPIPYWQLNMGETAFRAVERALRPDGGHMMGMPDGSIQITNASVAGRHSGELREGVNILSFKVELSDDKRHSKYTVKGQSRKGTGKDALRIAEDEDDEEVERYRPKIMVLEQDTDKGRAKKRAGAEKERAAGESIKGEIVVQGFRDDGGELWMPNRLVYVNSPILMHLEQDMLIEKVRFHQDSKKKSKGSTATLSLVDPRTYKGQGGKKSKSDKAWK